MISCGTQLAFTVDGESSESGMLTLNPNTRTIPQRFFDSGSVATDLKVKYVRRRDGHIPREARWRQEPGEMETGR
jgi:hypothetical protein